MIPLIERYRDLLPVGPDTPIVSLGEGNTPLVPLPRLSERLDVELYAKFEGMNPTGSFKDRGMTMAISKAVEEGAEAEVLPVEAQMMASAPSSTAFETAMVMPRSLKLPVGFMPSNLA